LAARRGDLASFEKELSSGGWMRLKNKPIVEVKLFEREEVHYLLARSRPRRRKERAIRRRQRRGLAQDLKALHTQIAKGQLKQRDKILERVGRLKERYPKARQFATIVVTNGKPAELTWSWNIPKYKTALAGDGAYLLRSNQGGWSAAEFWTTYIQLTVVERVFRVLKSELLLRPIWHHYSGRTQAHVMICVLAYALWKTLDHLAKRAGLRTEIRKRERRWGNAQPKSRPMTPQVILRVLADLQIGDIRLKTVAGQDLCLTRVARPMGEQARILDALKLRVPDGLRPDRVL
jgi:hypothetical protein